MVETHTEGGKEIMAKIENVEMRIKVKVDLTWRSLIKLMLLLLRTLPRGHVTIQDLIDARE